jgi:hypothetical protein
MKQSILTTTMLAATAMGTRAFSVAPPSVRTPTMHLSSSIYLHDKHVVQSTTLRDEAEKKVEQAAKVEPKPAADALHKQEGPLSPLVLLAKRALGDDKLNKIRAKAIAIHSDVIASFVETAETSVGTTVLKTLFSVADKDGNGVIEETELAEALHTLGFEWLQEKQVKGILKRADLDENGAIDLQEWLQEAPKTLRTNLIKLAKKNGGELGLLA